MIHPETKEFYIGRRKSKTSPILDNFYRGSSISWYRELDKFTINEILVKEILIDEIKTFDDLCRIESKMISENIKNPLCRNAHVPSKGFYCVGPMNFDHKNKISNSLKGRIKTEDECKNISKSLSGYVHTETTKRNMSNSKKGHIVSDETKSKMSISRKLRIGENSPGFGKRGYDSYSSKKYKLISPDKDLTEFIGAQSLKDFLLIKGLNFNTLKSYSSVGKTYKGYILQK
jgi:hypothetical protein